MSDEPTILASYVGPSAYAPGVGRLEPLDQLEVTIRHLTSPNWAVTPAGLGDISKADLAYLAKVAAGVTDDTLTKTKLIAALTPVMAARYASAPTGHDDTGDSAGGEE